MLYRACTLIVWLLLAASGIGWWFEFTAPRGFGQGAALDDAPASPQIDARALQQLLGASSASAPDAAAAPAQYQLQGVVTHGKEIGAALIAETGKPPRVYRLGMEVAPGLRVLVLEPKAVGLGPAGGPPVQILRLPTSDNARVAAPDAAAPTAPAGLFPAQPPQPNPGFGGNKGPVQ